MIRLAIELSQGNELAFVFFGEGLIHAVDQHKSYAKLGERQEIENI